MNGLNELSTYGAHPKEFDPEQVKPVLNNLDIVFKWYLNYRRTKQILRKDLFRYCRNMKPLPIFSIK
jgi:hypothetical protein